MTEAAFLSAIESEPGEKVHLLAYADWCEENGEDDRAYALRWMAARGRFPHGVGMNYGWADGSKGQHLRYGSARECAVLPGAVFRSLPNAPATLYDFYGEIGDAVGAISSALRHLKDCLDITPSV